ncbi:hypothetical protein GCM10025772_02570 [Ferrimonas gelatinilytica]|uniref:ABC transporter substrate-binding protein n=1 Tax=Ferrimonas gelatinilytica TaxID=1255257 RepID=A0ABP9RTU3_9GAMM
MVNRSYFVALLVALLTVPAFPLTFAETSVDKKSVRLIAEDNQPATRVGLSAA